MFGILKKKLKEAISKLSKKVEEKEGKEIIEEQKPVKRKEAKKVEKKKEKEKKEKPKIIPRISREREIKDEDIKDVLWEIQLMLLESDVALEAAEKICEDVKNSLIGKRVKKGEIEKLVKKAFEEAIEKILSVPKIDMEKEIKKKKPFVVVFLGFNGAGKTTTIAKIGHLLKEKGYKVVFAAGDTFRAASIEQLEEHGKKLGINVIKHHYGADPAAVIFDAIKHAEARGIDVVLADTAGRTHTNQSLVEELRKICRVNKPDLKVLVLDALTGNDIVEQVKMFNEAVGVDAYVFTKVDVYEKGGSIISALYKLPRPVLFLGKGQEYGDLEKFDPKKIIKTLFS